MDYIRQSLGEDEELIHLGQFHWFYTVGAVMNVLFGFVLGIIILVLAIKFEPVLFPNGAAAQAVGWIDTIRAVHPGVKVLSFLMIVMGFYRYAHMMIVKLTTEIAITNKRLIYKRGLVARYVGEINIDRIEGVNVLQGILGRIFNYGRVMVRGMGVGEIVLPPIEDPIRFRKAIERARSV